MDEMSMDLSVGIRRNRTNGDFAFASVCSAHPEVLYAPLELALDWNAPLVIEATSNQVNPFGGYTGMTPADFIAFVSRIAEDMVRAYVRAGFTKVHLDCSEGCFGELAQLDDTTVAQRAARLAKVFEMEAGHLAGRLSCGIGTEVPPPGGARKEGEAITPTAPETAQKTLKVHHRAFEEAGLQAAWKRVVGLVVQSGLEFSPTHIDHFDMSQPDGLSSVLNAYPALSFEAHSTDYQLPGVYPNLAQRHFAVLKVGPALTHAYREAVYGLSYIDHWLNGCVHVSEVMERLMLDEPLNWSKHYITTDPGGGTCSKALIAVAPKIRP